jgi:RNA polymerase sigma-70 factor (ECF subfamily)
MIDALAKVAAAPTDGTFDPLGLLVEGMRGGSEEALASLYQATVAQLHALAMAILRNPADAEDVVCATYVQAWESASQFDRERGPAIGWLMMMCRSRALDMRRRARLQPNAAGDDQLMLMPSTDATAEDLIFLTEQTSRVRGALLSLTPERRHLISLAFLRDFTHQEIADYTSLPLGTVKSHLRRAFAQLRKQLEETR